MVRVSLGAGRVVRLALALLLAFALPTLALRLVAADEEAAPANPAPETLARLRRQHLARLGVERWHDRGRLGDGVKIAILDTGFRGYRAYLGKGLPTRVQARSFRSDGNLEAHDSQHGILCAEIIHHFAPQAQLLLANWEDDQPASFLDAVRWARQEGARIISCSVIMPSWSDGEGGGAVHRELTRILGNGRGTRDLLCFACAGNTAERHWTGPFAPDADGSHLWADGRTANTLTPWGSERVAVELYGDASVPLDVEVSRHDSGAIVGEARLTADLSEEFGRAVVRFEPAPRVKYAVRVRGPAESPAPASRFHMVVLGGNLATSTSQGSIAFPGDGAGVLTIGAIDSANRRLSYSSCGPNSRHPKPDFVAPVPFPSVCRQRPFGGTSAAAPQAAALAAVLWSQQGHWTADQVRQALRRSAQDLGPVGHDCETGYGLIRLPVE